MEAQESFYFKKWNRCLLFSTLFCPFTYLASAVCKALCYIVQSSVIIYKSASGD